MSTGQKPKLPEGDALLYLLVRHWDEIYAQNREVLHLCPPLYLETCRPVMVDGEERPVVGLFVHSGGQELDAQIWIIFEIAVQPLVAPDLGKSLFIGPSY